MPHAESRQIPEGRASSCLCQFAVMISICSHFKTAVLSSVTRQRRARDYPCLFSHQERLCSISAEKERDEGKGESERRLGQKLKNGKLAAFESDIREET